MDLNIVKNTKKALEYTHKFPSYEEILEQNTIDIKLDKEPSYFIKNDILYKKHEDNYFPKSYYPIINNEGNAMYNKFPPISYNICYDEKITLNHYENFIDFNRKMHVYFSGGYLIYNIPESKNSFRIYNDYNGIVYNILYSEYFCNNNFGRSNNTIEEIIYNTTIPTEEDFINFQDLIDELKEKYKKNLEQIKEISLSVYKDNVDIKTLNEITEVIIKFDKVTIKNNSLSRNIEDIFVKLTFDEKGILTGRLKGIRTTMSFEEYHSSYTHSHLSTGNIGEWGNYCLGSTDISVLVSELQLNFNALRYEALLYRLTTYIGWESLQGGPYRRLSNVRLPNNGVSPIYYNSTTITTIINEIKEIPKIPIKFKKGDYLNSYIIDFNDKSFQKILCEECNLYNSYIVNKDIVTGEYFSNTSRNVYSSYSNRIKEINKLLTEKGSCFTFKDKPVICKVKEMKSLSELKDDNIIKVVHPQLEQDISRYLESKIFKYLHYNNLINKYERNDKQKSIA